MARKAAAGKTTRRPGTPARRRKAARPAAKKRAVARSAKRPVRRPAGARRPVQADALLSPMDGSAPRTVGGVQLDVQRAGAARVKRLIYPVGFRWSTDMKAITGTDLCMHAHVGFLAHGQIHIQYGDGCVQEFKAPQVVAIDPGHDGWVVGDEPAVMIEFDFEGQTVERLGMPKAHRHA